jgi:hypothetical protein
VDGEIAVIERGTTVARSVPRARDLSGSPE